MKRSILIALTLSLALSASAQTLTVTDLTNLLAKKTFQAVNQWLTQKGWEYYTSENGDGFGYIQWTYEHNSYNDKARGWMKVYFYEEAAGYLEYQFFNDNSYKSIDKSLAGAGFKTDGIGEWGDDYAATTYNSARHTLEIVYSYNSDESYNTRYKVNLTLKGSFFDPKNGKKRSELDEGGYAEYTLKNGDIEGLVKHYDENGTLIQEFSVNNNLRQGPFKNYGPNGQLLEEGTFKNDEYNGELKTYHPNGKLMSVMTYRDGQLEGESRTYFENGKLESSSHYKQGALSGLRTDYAEDGKHYQETLFENDEPKTMKVRTSDGLLVSVYESKGDHVETTEFEYNGKVKRLTTRTVMGPDDVVYSNYQHREGDSVMTTLLQLNGHNVMVNGGGLQLKGKSLWQMCDNGSHNPQSAWAETTEDLYLRNLREMKEGMSIPDMSSGNYLMGGCSFADNDIPRGSVCHFEMRDGSMNGHFAVFIDPDLYKQIYIGRSLQERDKMIPSTLDTTKLRVYRKGSYKNNEKDGWWVIYHPQTGKKVAEGRYNQGMLEGTWKYYAPNGYLLEESTYHNDLAEGPSKIYGLYDAKSGKIDTLREDANYREGLLHGSYKKTVGGQTTECTYTNGKLNGTHTLTNAEGRVVTHYSNGHKDGRMERFDAAGKLCYATRYKMDAETGPVELMKDGVLAFAVELDDGKATRVKDLRIAGAAETYEILTGMRLKLERQGKDSIVTATYYTGDALPDLKCDNYDAMVAKLDLLWAMGKCYLHGPLTIKSTHSGAIVASGQMDHGHKQGSWTFRLEKQRVTVTVDYSAIPVSETYQTLEGLPYSGEIEIEDRDHQIMEVRKIKDGVLNKTKYTDLTTGKSIKMKGSAYDYLPIGKLGLR